MFICIWYKYQNANNSSSFFFRSNYFYLGWALCEHQEFGKRGSRKHMTEQVKQLEELQKKVTLGELEVNKIPKIKTIENWITRYNQEHKKESAAREL